MLLRVLPLGLLVLLLDLIVSVQAAKQCRLVAHNNQAAFETSPAAPTPTTSNTGPKATATNSPSGSGSPTSSSIPSPTPFNYGTDKIRAVNLGGWFVLEPWITPSFFERTGNDAIVDEYTLGQLMNRDAANGMLKDHWESWITEDDFVQMRAAGLNHVRIPIGYWSVPLTSSDTSGSTDPSPYIPGAWTYLLRALNWAKSNEIHVIIDLHGAPGSQNGYDNSGQRTGDPRWAKDPANVQRTLDTLKFVAREIGGMIDVIELMNEAAGFLGGDTAAVIKQFWTDGYAAVREGGGGGLKVMIGDAFLTVSSWTGFLKYPEAQGVLMDVHQYQIFSNRELSRSFDDHIAYACTMKADLANYSDNNIWTIMGEWSNAITDCTKWLNGRGVGARWDGSRPADASSDGHAFGSCEHFTGSYSGFSSEYKTFLRKYFEVQLEIGESAEGWAFWTWKAEQSDEWSYQKGLEGGWIPKDPTDRKYPNICG